MDPRYQSFVVERLLQIWLGDALGRIHTVSLDTTIGSVGQFGKCSALTEACTAQYISTCFAIQHQFRATRLVRIS